MKARAVKWNFEAMVSLLVHIVHFPVQYLIEKNIQYALNDESQTFPIFHRFKNGAT